MSVSHLAVAYDRSMSCINRFLGSRGLDSEHLRSFAQLKANHKNKHVTSGKHDNSRIRGVLEAVPLWSYQDKIVRAAMNTVFHRQVELFGCPAVQ